MKTLIYRYRDLNDLSNFINEPDNNVISIIHINNDTMECLYECSDAIKAISIRAKNGGF